MVIPSPFIWCAVIAEFIPAPSPPKNHTTVFSTQCLRLAATVLVIALGVKAYVSAPRSAPSRKDAYFNTGVPIAPESFKPLLYTPPGDAKNVAISVLVACRVFPRKSSRLIAPLVGTPTSAL